MSILSENINNIETKFKSNLKDSSGTVFKVVKTIPISDQTTIYQISPGYTSYYYNTAAKKSKICLHFTAGTITGDIASLTKKDNCLSVHYVVDRLGNVYNLIPLDKEKGWSYHLGKNTVGTNTVMSKSTIGIEISNYGPLSKKADGFYNTYGQKYSVDEKLVEKIAFRGYEYYCSMTPEQKRAVLDLIDYLCETCDINHEYMLENMFASDKDAVNFNGIFTHAQVRKDKYDWPYEMIKFVKDSWEESQKKPEPVVEEKKSEPEPVKQCVDPKPVVKTTEVKTQQANSKSSSFFDMIIDLFSNLFKK